MLVLRFSVGGLLTDAPELGSVIGDAFQNGEGAASDLVRRETLRRSSMCLFSGFKGQG